MEAQTCPTRDSYDAIVVGSGLGGVSAAIAVAGAVGAKKEHAPIAITVVIFWAIVMIFALPLASG